MHRRHPDAPRALSWPLRQRVRIGLAALATLPVLAALATLPFASPAAAQAGAPVVPVVPLVEVEIRAYAFSPAELSVPAGTTVRWVNREKRTAHSVRFTGAQGFESPRFFPDEHWEHRFEQAGRYPYECGPHPEMKGVVVVQ